MIVAEGESTHSEDVLVVLYLGLDGERLVPEVAQTPSQLLGRAVVLVVVVLKKKVNG